MEKGKNKKTRRIIKVNGVRIVNSQNAVKSGTPQRDAESTHNEHDWKSERNIQL